MLTAQQIIDATRKSHPQVYRNKGHVNVYSWSVKDWKAEDGTRVRTLRAKARDTSKNRSGVTHTIEIDYYGKSKNGGVYVTCDCAYFFFNCAWVLWEKDASDKDSSYEDYGEAGWAPSITNPSSSPRACKHIIRALTANLHKLVPGAHKGRKVT